MYWRVPIEGGLQWLDRMTANRFDERMQFPSHPTFAEAAQFGAGTRLLYEDSLLVALPWHGPESPDLARVGRIYLV